MHPKFPGPRFQTTTVRFRDSEKGEKGNGQTCLEDLVAGPEAALLGGGPLRVEAADEGAHALPLAVAGDGQPEAVRRRLPQPHLHQRPPQRAEPLHRRLPLNWLVGILLGQLAQPGVS